MKYSPWLEVELERNRVSNGPKISRQCWGHREMKDLKFSFKHINDSGQTYLKSWKLDNGI